MAFRGTFDYTLDAKNRLTVPPAFGLSSPAGSCSPRASSAVLPSGPRPPTTRTPPPRSRLPSALQGSPEAHALLQRQLLDTELDAAGRMMLPAFLLDHARLSKDVVVTGSGDLLEIWDRATWRTTTMRSHPTSTTSPPPLATLLDMTIPHVPVLAGEAIEVLIRARSDRRRLHGRRGRPRAPAGGPSARRRADRHRPRPDRRRAVCRASGELARRRGSSAPRSPRASSCWRDEDVLADIVLMDLGMSSMQIDTRERGFSYSTTRRWTCAMDPAELTAHEIVNRYEPRQLETSSATSARSATRADRPRDRARPLEAPLDSTTELVDVIIRAVPAPARFAAGHPAKRVFQALRIAVNDELGQLDAALPLAWDVLRVGGKSARSPSIRLRTAASSASSHGRAQGCICPPDLPICACGREPEAELLSRRSIAPTPARSPPTRARARRACALPEATRGPRMSTRPAAAARPARRPAPPRTAAPMPARRARRAPHLPGPPAPRASAPPRCRRTRSSPPLPRPDRRYRSTPQRAPQRRRCGSPPAAPRSPWRRRDGASLRQPRDGPRRAQPRMGRHRRLRPDRHRRDAGLDAEAQLRYRARGRRHRDARALQRHAEGRHLPAQLGRPHPGALPV